MAKRHDQRHSVVRSRISVNKKRPTAHSLSLSGPSVTSRNGGVRGGGVLNR
jgi:hypothetical protein